ncbi:ABC transporter substrate-binding protein [Streptomyces sp. NPDC091377]|uniref:ABC transporter substrate-binding protein n=1 Tax=Streptomyces sp. NPDC091377 TaxID=3365995 RepID=UPI0037FD6881
MSRRNLLRGAASVGVVGPALASLGAVASAAGGGAPPGAGLTGVTLKVLVASPHLALHRTVLAPAWQELTGGTLEVTALDDARLTGRIIDDVTSGTGRFDVFDHPYPGLGALAEAGALLDLTGWIGTRRGLDTEDFLTSVYDACTLYRGRRYGLPHDADQHLVFFNRELLGAHGLRPPATWDEFDAIAARLTREGGGRYHGAVLRRQPHTRELGCSFVNRLVGHGGDLVDRSGRPTLTTGAAVAAVRHLIAVAPHALHVPPGRPGADPAADAFLGGRVGLIESWTGLARRADDPARSEIAGKWGAVALPLGGRNRRRRTPLNGGYVLGVSPASQHRAAALAYLTWATGKDMTRWQATRPHGAPAPGRAGVLHSEEYARTAPGTVGLIRDGLDGTPVVWPKGAQDPANLQRLVDELALAVAGEQSATRALRTAQAGWRH